MYHTVGTRKNEKSEFKEGCIVLDLDHTLVSTQGEKDFDKFHELDLNHSTNSEIRERVYVLRFEGDSMWGIARPYYREFLEWCFNNFDVVCVWSAGQYKYVHSVVEYLFRGMRQPAYIFTRKDCEDDKYGNPLKPLTKLVKFINDDVGPNIPQNKVISMKNIFIVDDNEDTFVFNPFNAIHIEPYNPELTLEDLASTKDDHLLRVMRFFDDRKRKMSARLTQSSQQAPGTQQQQRNISPRSSIQPPALPTVANRNVEQEGRITGSPKIVRRADRPSANIQQPNTSLGSPRRATRQSKIPQQ